MCTRSLRHIKVKVNAEHGFSVLISGKNISSVVTLDVIRRGRGEHLLIIQTLKTQQSMIAAKS